jgi:hypothetical protein
MQEAGRKLANLSNFKALYSNGQLVEKYPFEGREAAVWQFSNHNW